MRLLQTAAADLRGSHEPSEKIYRFLLRAYSRDFRSRYAGPMEQLFRDLLREVLLRRVDDTWARTLADWVVSVPPT